MVDSRTTEEYIEGHIPTAISIPHDAFYENHHLLPKDKNQLLIFYCHHETCNYSIISAWKARETGYTNIVRYAAGSNGWRNSGKQFCNHAKKRRKNNLNEDIENSSSNNNSDNSSNNNSNLEAITSNLRTIRMEIFKACAATCLQYSQNVTPLCYGNANCLTDFENKRVACVNCCINGIRAQEYTFHCVNEGFGLPMGQFE